MYINIGQSLQLPWPLKSLFRAYLFLEIRPIQKYFQKGFFYTSGMKSSNGDAENGSLPGSVLNQAPHGALQSPLEQECQYLDRQCLHVEGIEHALTVLHSSKLYVSTDSRNFRLNE